MLHTRVYVRSIVTGRCMYFILTVSAHEKHFHHFITILYIFENLYFRHIEVVYKSPSYQYFSDTVY
jgi:hypothetical protein